MLEVLEDLGLELFFLENADLFPLGGLTDCLLNVLILELWFSKWSSSGDRAGKCLIDISGTGG